MSALRIPERSPGAVAPLVLNGPPRFTNSTHLFTPSFEVTTTLHPQALSVHTFADTFRHLGGWGVCARFTPPNSFPRFPQRRSSASDGSPVTLIFSYASRHFPSSIGVPPDQPRRHHCATHALPQLQCFHAFPHTSRHNGGRGVPPHGIPSCRAQ
jgi:hypothetical protein